MKIKKILDKTYKKNQEKGQYRSVFKLNICQRIIEFSRYFYLVFFMLQYAMDAI